MKYRQKRRRPLRTLAVVILLLLLTAGYLYWGNAALQVTHTDIFLPALPEDFDGFRGVLLADLHGAEFGRDNQALFDAVAAEAPEAILVAGDLVDQYRGIDWASVQTVAAGLTAIAPVYYVTGNHEWVLSGEVPALKNLLTAAGWTVLSNEALPLERNGDTVMLAGIDDPNGYADQKTPETLAEEVRSGYGDTFWMLLAHRNDRFAEQYSLLGADLVLSGHGHGGVIRLPGTDGLLSTNRTLFPSYTAGLYEENGSTLFVTRGLGNSGPSIRIFNRPEVAVFTMHRG